MSPDRRPAKKVSPVFGLYVKESRLDDNPISAMVYNLLPVGAQRFLGRLFPASESVQQALETTDFRIRHGLPKGYVPLTLP